MWQYGDWAGVGRHGQEGMVKCDRKMVAEALHGGAMPGRETGLGGPAGMGQEIGSNSGTFNVLFFFRPSASASAPASPTLFRSRSKFSSGADVGV